MKIDSLPSGSPQCPPLRIYEFGPMQATQFRDFCLALDSGEREIDSRPEDSSFACVLDPADWDNIAGLVEPFCQTERAGCQWLAGADKISLLFSCDGTW